MTEQRVHGGATRCPQPLQRRPQALNQVLLQVLGVRQRRVEENQLVVLQDGATHVSTVTAAVAGGSFVESDGGSHTFQSRLPVFCVQRTAEI